MKSRSTKWSGSSYRFQIGPAVRGTINPLSVPVHETARGCPNQHANGGRGRAEERGRGFWSLRRPQGRQDQPRLASGGNPPPKLNLIRCLSRRRKAKCVDGIACSGPPMLPNPRSATFKGIVTSTGVSGGLGLTDKTSGSVIFKGCHGMRVQDQGAHVQGDFPVGVATLRPGS
jgi:hypothetical protein